MKSNADKHGMKSAASRATVCVIRTDEERMIARSVYRILGPGTVNKKD